MNVPNQRYARPCDAFSSQPYIVHFGYRNKIKRVQSGEPAGSQQVAHFMGRGPLQEMPIISNYNRSTNPAQPGEMRQRLITGRDI